LNSEVVIWIMILRRAREMWGDVGGGWIVMVRWAAFWVFKG
jgi:hypothetical protein